MTVTADVARWDYTGNGVLDTYPFTAEIYAATDLKVYVSDVLQVLNVNYTIAVGSIGVPAGGNIVFTAGSIPALSAPISIILDLPLTQLVDYIEGDKFPAEVHERALDRLIKICQSFKESLTRVAKLPVSTLIDLVFPNPVANQYLGWNAAADNLENKALPVATTATQYEVDALITYGSGTDYTKATIDTTLTAVGIVNPVTVLLRPGAWNIDADADYSAYTNVIFRIPQGSYFDVDALMTLTLPSPANIIATPNQQIFSGDGTVAFTAKGSIYTEWFGTTGDGVADDTAEFQAAINSLGTANSSPGVINLISNKTYLVASPILFRGNQTYNFNHAIISSTSTTNVLESAVDTTATITGVVFTNPTITTSTADVGISMQGVNLSIINNPRITNSKASGIGIWLKHGDATAQCYFNQINEPSIYATNGTGIKFEGTAAVSGANRNVVIGGRIMDSDKGIWFVESSNNNYVFGTTIERSVAGGTVGIDIDGSGRNEIHACIENMTEDFNIDATSGVNELFIVTATAAAYTDSGTSILHLYTGDASATDRRGIGPWIDVVTTHVSGGDTTSFDWGHAAVTQNVLLQFFRNTSTSGNGRIIFYDPGTATIGTEINTADGVYVTTGTIGCVAGGSTAISSGVGSVKMTTVNAANNAAWIPIKYAGTIYYVPAWAAHNP